MQRKFQEKGEKKGKKGGKRGRVSVERGYFSRSGMDSSSTCWILVCSSMWRILPLISDHW
jgi:hypothetical protein